MAVSRLVAGRSSGFRVIFRRAFPPTLRASAVALAAVVAGYSGASAADLHGLPFSSRPGAGTYNDLTVSALPGEINQKPPPTCTDRPPQ